MPIYLKYASITTGESLAAGHLGTAGWIEVDSWGWGAARSIKTEVGKSSKREAGAVSISDIVVSKEMDSTSMPLLQAVLFGQGVDCYLECTTQQGTALENYLSIKLTNTFVSSYSVSGHGEDRPTESLSLNFSKIEATYQGYDDSGKPDSAKKKTMNYDLALAKAV